MLTPMSREVELGMMGQKRSRGDSGALSAEGRAGSNRKVSLLLVRQDERRTSRCSRGTLRSRVGLIFSWAGGF